MYTSLFYSAALLCSAVWARIPEEEQEKWQQLNVVEKGGKPHHHQGGNCCNDGFHPENVRLLADVGAYAFNFGDGNSGLDAFQSFYFNIPSNSLGYEIRLWDCFCSGDSFKGVWKSAPSPTNPLNAFGKPIPAGCMFYDNTSEGCWDTREMYNYDTLYVTDPGFYNLTIEVAKSPYRKGTGFVALYSVCIHPTTYEPVPCCEINEGCNLTQYR